MNNQPTFIFLHGAGTGAWVWDRVIAALPMNSVALEVPGRKVGATPDNCAAEIFAELERREIDCVVLVLHSLAGVLAAGLATRLGSRLEACVFVSAVIPQPGGSFVDAIGFANRTILRLLFKFNPKGLRPSPAMIRRELCNDLSEQDADLVVSRYEAELPGLYLTPIASAPSLPICLYVKLLKDQSVLPAQQDRMIARLGSARVSEIDAGHLVMLSSSEALAQELMRVLSEG